MCHNQVRPVSLAHLAISKWPAGVPVPASPPLPYRLCFRRSCGRQNDNAQVPFDNVINDRLHALNVSDVFVDAHTVAGKRRHVSDVPCSSNRSITFVPPSASVMKRAVDKDECQQETAPREQFTFHGDRRIQEAKTSPSGRSLSVGPAASAGHNIMWIQPTDRFNCSRWSACSRFRAPDSSALAVLRTMGGRNSAIGPSSIHTTRRSC